MADAIKKQKKSNQTKKSGDVSHRSIGTVIMIMFLVVIVTSLSVLGYISYWTGTNMLKNNFKSMTGELLGTVEHATVRYLNQFEFIVEYLSKDSNVLSVDTYADSEPWLIKVLDNVLDSQSDVLNVYYAPDAGGFYVRPASELPEGFDPRVRPWYEDAKKTLAVKLFGQTRMLTQQLGKLLLQLLKVYMMGASLKVLLV